MFELRDKKISTILHIKCSLMSSYAFSFARAQPNRINWNVIFAGAPSATLGDMVENYILTNLSTEVFNDRNTVKIGNNYLYHSDVITTYDLQFELVDDVSGLLNTESAEFQAAAQAFCSDVSFYNNLNGRYVIFQYLGQIFY